MVGMDISWILIAILGTAVGLILVLRIFQDINFGIWLLILLFPFTQLRIVDTPFGSLQPSQLLVIVTLASLLLREAVKKEGLKPSPLPINKALVLFLLVSIFSLGQFIWLDFVGTSATMPYTRPGRVDPIVRGATSILNILIGFATFYVISRHLKTEQAIKKGIVFWLISGTAASLFAIYAFLTNLLKFLPPLPALLAGGQGGVVPRELDMTNPLGSPLIPRAASVLQEPRHLAIFLAPLVFFFILLFMKRTFLIRPWAQSAMMALTIIGFLLTLSRITFILAFAILVVYYISTVSSRNRTPPNRSWPLVLLVIIAPALIAANAFITHFFKVDLVKFSIFQWASVIGGSHLTYFAEQMASFETAWRTFLGHPFLGGGIGSYYYFVKLFDAPTTSSVVNNVYLELLAETGLLGIATFIALIFSFFKSLSASEGHLEKLQETLVDGFKGSFKILLVGYMFLSAFFYPFVWGLMGLAVACKVNWNQRGAPGEKPLSRVENAAPTK
ncbi:MAG: O-antigen ligase family protein [Actinobacteria bacterium]|nr:O-antigen ligase family protein [Actinomycetota bacterium]